MGLELIRWKANERVGLPDQTAMSDLIVDEMIRQNRDLTLPETQTAKVFGGFDLTDLGAGLARLDYGRAILKIEKDQISSHGFFLGLQSPTSYQLDFSGAADDDYGIYVRAVYSDTGFENRVFWDPSGSSEFTDYTATRRSVTWEATYVSTGASSPGAEWMLVWEVTVVSGAITVTTDKRSLFFEGDAGATFAFGWGDGANDRNAARGTYGVMDRWTWDQAVRRQLADIIGAPAGAHTWWPTVPVELTQLATEHYGEADGANNQGHHKDFSFGSDGRFFHWSSSAGVNDWTAELAANELAANTPQIFFTLGEQTSPPDRLGVIKINPYGQAFVGPQNAGDYAGMAYWDDHVTEYWKLDATDDLVKRWAANGTTVMALETGTGASAPGLHLFHDPVYAGEGFLLQSIVDVYLRMPWSSLVTDVGGSRAWEMDGPIDGDVGSQQVSVGTLGAKSGNTPVFFEFSDFPDGATLLAIDVVWSQDVIGATNEMRMYAARHVAGGNTPLDTHGAATDVSLAYWTEQDLHSPPNYIQYVKDVFTQQVRRFKPNQNNTEWDRRKHKLVLGFVTPDTSAASCTITDIRMLWRYQNISPWPDTAGLA